MTIHRYDSSTSSSSSKSMAVVSIECLKGGGGGGGGSTADMLQTGDIVEEILFGDGHSVIRAPFKSGKAGLQRVLHASFKSKDTVNISVRVRRGSNSFAELKAYIVPNESAGKKQYMLRAVDDPNYIVGFLDRTEAECFALQAARLEDVLAGTELQDGYVSYPWEKRMKEMQSVVPNCSSGFLSILFLPKLASESRYNDLEDTLARANAWMNASQASGVPVAFVSVQTESLLTKISGGKASCTVSAGSLSDLSNLATTSLYGFEDYHGLDIGVVRAVRLWYSSFGGEIPVEIELKEGDTKLGFAISRTEEGFIYISSVIDGDENAPSSRSGLCNLHKEAMKASKLLVVSRLGNQKVLPWITSSTGAIRCYDTVSLSQKLSLHRHAKVSVTIHVFLWERNECRAVETMPVTEERVAATLAAVVERGSAEDFSFRFNDIIEKLTMLENSLDRDTDHPVGENTTAGETSFRFHDLVLPNNNWGGLCRSSIGQGGLAPVILLVAVDVWPEPIISRGR
ncbi:uncharacterized protein LOC124929634 [Impatiens glandulifera]|uniref:uncharacterized protein LOC124929634 n=1 Tax=Impatiens glandulifera TaxID=253017 RepID=UPI001FB13746|nr:uncharacterized protein LOC124929634 [Impatiens glandulifera]